jgi:hypothetical protein
MAQKKITELQLIAAVTSGLSIPSDNGTQSYRFTAAQMLAYILGAGNVPLSALALDIFNGLTQVTADDADFGILIDSSDANKTKKFALNEFIRTGYRAISSTDTLTGADATAVLSGASFTLTLPTAVGRTGKQYRIIHGGTSFSQVYTLATTSSQTIGGIASAAYKLVTSGEVLVVESNGANWIIAGRHTSTPWVDAGNMTITATTTNPTKPTTSIDKIRWRRYGDSNEYEYNIAFTAAGSAGSGDYKFALPTNHNMDSSKNTFYATTPGIYSDGAAVATYKGRFHYMDEVTASGYGSVIPFDATTFRLGGTTFANTGNIVSSIFAAVGNNRSYHMSFTAGMADYQP